jgi:hypothetical protein
MGASIMDLPTERDAEVTEELVTMVRMILQGAQALGTGADTRGLRERRRPRRPHRG